MTSDERRVTSDVSYRFLIPLYVLFSHRRAKKEHTENVKYHAAVRPELVEGQAKTWRCDAE